jgi:neutral trehalase
VFLLKEFMSPQTLTTLTNWREWQKTEEGSRLFPTVHSFAWFIRRHEKPLVESGALIKMRNQWHLIPTEFYSAVIDLLRRNTQDRIKEVSQ